MEIYKIIDPYLLGSVNQSFADFVVSNTVNTFKDTAEVVAGYTFNFKMLDLCFIFSFFIYLFIFLFFYDYYFLKLN